MECEEKTRWYSFFIFPNDPPLEYSNELCLEPLYKFHEDEAEHVQISPSRTRRNHPSMSIGLQFLGSTRQKELHPSQQDFHPAFIFISFGGGSFCSVWLLSVPLLAFANWPRTNEWGAPARSEEVIHPRVRNIPASENEQPRAVPTTATQPLRKFGPPTTHTRKYVLSTA